MSEPSYARTAAGCWRRCLEMLQKLAECCRRHCEERLRRRFHEEWIAPESEARLGLQTTQPGGDDVARSSFRRTDRYPHAVWRNFCVFGTEPFDVAGHVAVARPGREDVQAQRRGGRCC